MSCKHIWVDADSCPAKAKTIILQTAISYGAKVTYVANRPIPFSIQNPLFTMYVCEAKENAADDVIVADCEEGDIVVTRDLPLARRLVEKGIAVLNDRGVIFTEAILKKMLAERELSLHMQSLGIATARWNTYNGKDMQNFADSLQSLF